MGNGDAATVTLAYDAAKETLKAQDTTLGNVRTRASGVVTIAALLTTFAAGVGLVNLDPTRGPVLPDAAAWMLLGVLVVMGILVLYVLWPIPNWHYGPNADTILQKHASETEAEIRTFIAKEMVRGIADNGNAIRNKQTAFRMAVALLLLETVVLVASLTLLR